MRAIKILLILIFISISCAKIRITPDLFTSHSSPNWEMYGGNPARTNVYPGDIALPLKLIWKYRASSAIGKTMLVVNGVVYFTTLDGRLYALNIKTGEKIGHKKLEMDATCAYQDTSLFIAYRYGNLTLFKYDVNRARTAWKIDAGDISSEPLVLESHIIITALYKHIDLYNSADGVRIWQTKIDDQIRSSPACIQGVVVFGCDDGAVYAVKEINGEIIWKFKTDASVQATPVLKDSVAYVGSSDKFFYAIHLKTGKLIWDFETDGQILHPAAVNDSLVIFGSTDSHLYCLNRFSGQEIWSFEAGSVISTSPLICNDNVFFGSLDHHYYGINLTTGDEMWKYKTKGRVMTAPVVWGHYLIGAAENDIVYAFLPEEEK